MRLAGSCIAITGATGFLGRYLARVLRARGARVVGVVREPARGGDLLRHGVALRRADLTRPAELAPALAGCDALVANAAYFSLRDARWEPYLRVNVEGAENLLAAALSVGLRRVVLISSVSAYRMRLLDFHRGGGIAEDHPQLDGQTPRRRFTVYGISKALAEQHAWRVAAAEGLQLTTLRPSGLFGAYDAKVLPLMRRVSRWPLAPAWARLSFVYAGDVAEAAALALERPAAIGRAYNVAGGRETLWELLAALARAEGRAYRRVPLPIPVTWLFDSGRAERELGWARRPLRDAWRETLELEREAIAGAAAAPPPLELL